MRFVGLPWGTAIEGVCDRDGAEQLRAEATDERLERQAVAARAAAARLRWMLSMVIR
jgi:hypothetical protein